MDLVQVRIKGTVITNRYGALSDGDILRTDPEYARHLVEDCAAGDIIAPTATQGPESQAEASAGPIVRAPRKKKEPAADLLTETGQPEATGK